MTDEAPSLTEIIDNTPPPAEKPKPDDAPAPGEEAEAPQGDEPAPDDERSVPLAALQEEREKRKGLEDRLALSEQRIEALGAKPEPKAEEEPLIPEGTDFWEAPEKIVATALQKQEARLTERFTEVIRTERLNNQLAMARVRHTDFDDALQAFEAAAAKDPTLVTSARSHVDSGQDLGEFIYQAGLRETKLAPFGGDLAKYEAEVEARVRKELAKEAEANQNRANKRRVPGSVTDGAAGTQDKVAARPSLDEILAGK